MQSIKTEGSAIRTLKTNAAQLTHREGVELQCYLSELEQTIVILSEHIAELESAIYTLDNERAIKRNGETTEAEIGAGENAQAVAEAEAEEKIDALVGPGGSLSPGAGASFAGTSPRSAVLFRFDPRPTASQRDNAPIHTIHGPHNNPQSENDLPD